MGFKCGIVGLPNIGKSTLFNALTSTIAAESANYPFCTIEPNIGRVAVHDVRLEKLAEMAGSQKIVPTMIDIVDIAGLVKGASKGEGLGNQFLSTIREVDAILHMVRCFADENITHVEGEIDPVRDIELIETELIIADYDSLKKRLENLDKKNKYNKDRSVLEEKELMEAALELLAQGKPARGMLSKGYSYDQIKKLQLITTKPYMFVCNVSEADVSSGNDYCKKVSAYAANAGVKTIIISAKIEAEISNLPNDEKAFFLESLNLKETGLNQLARCGYEVLGLSTFFTIGPKEAHAWTIKNGTLAPGAAGEIHTDFEKGFIRAEVVSYADYVKYGGEQQAKDNGRARLEGKEYVVQDGDIINFRFNV